VAQVCSRKMAQDAAVEHCIEALDDEKWINMMRR
jgi:hypothetical protein